MWYRECGSRRGSGEARQISKWCRHSVQNDADFLHLVPHSHLEPSAAKLEHSQRVDTSPVISTQQKPASSRSPLKLDAKRCGIASRGMSRVLEGLKSMEAEANLWAFWPPASTAQSFPFFPGWANQGRAEWPPRSVIRSERGIRTKSPEREAASRPRRHPSPARKH